MTHEELLREVNKNANWDDGDNSNALRAVLELHKPHDEYPKQCAGCEVDDPWYWRDYPCPTIKAIQKELANES